MSIYDGRDRWSATPRRPVPKRNYSVAELQRMFSGNSVPGVLDADELERVVVERLKAMAQGQPGSSWRPPGDGGFAGRDADELERVVMERLQRRPDVRALVAHLAQRGLL